MPTTQVGENKLFWARSRGEGAATILIHGAGGNHLHWPGSLRRWPKATVYALDLPGHGRSEGNGRERIDDYAADVVDFAEAVGLERAVLVGHSMGGAIAQTIALAAPDLVQGLVLMGTGAKLGVAPAILEGLERDFEGTTELIARWAWGPAANPTLVAQGQEMMLETGPRVVLGDFVACDRFDVRDRVDGIAAPTLVLTGSEDRMTPPRFGEWLANQIPGARFSLLEGAGHMLMLERPRWVTEAVEDFFRGF
ncbi:MAG: alpha/beta fold hydrolase [Anaerolineae bacterium]